MFADKEKARAYHNEWKKKWRAANPEKARLAVRINYHKNVEKRREHARNYRKMLMQNPEKRAEHNRKISERRRNRIASDPMYKLEKNLRAKVNMAIKSNYKKGEGIGLLGCEVSEYRAYLEALWEPGMSWENYGHAENCWEIDHIVPVKAFDLTKPEMQKACFHYSNTRPLWFIDNRRSGNALSSRNYANPTAPIQESCFAPS